VKKRPTLKLRAPATIVPGQEFVAVAEVIAQKPVPARAVTIRLEGVERVAVGCGRARALGRAARTGRTTPPRYLCV
jgi:hypothetical protein